MNTQPSTIDAGEEQETKSAAALPAIGPRLPGSIGTSPAKLEHLWRVAGVYSRSSLVPKHMQGKQENCMVALDMAELLDENPLIVMQNIYFVNDRAGWYTQYLIARVNKSGLIKGRITWVSKGTGDALEVTARARLADSDDEIVEAMCSMTMAKAEQWTKNPKYASMPEHMLKWRAAAFLIRLNFPEVMLGMPTADELEDVQYGGNLERGPDGVFTPGATATARPSRADVVEYIYVKDDGEIGHVYTHADEYADHLERGLKSPDNDFHAVWAANGDGLALLEKTDKANGWHTHLSKLYLDLCEKEDAEIAAAKAKPAPEAAKPEPAQEQPKPEVKAAEPAQQQPAAEQQTETPQPTLPGAEPEESLDWDAALHDLQADASACETQQQLDRLAADRAETISQFPPGTKAKWRSWVTTYAKGFGPDGKKKRK